MKGEAQSSPPLLKKTRLGDFMINFILGIMFMAVALPILDKLVELFQTVVNAKISDINVDVQSMGLPEQHTSAIGFMVQSEEEEYDDYDE